MPDFFLYAHFARIISLAAHYSEPTISFGSQWVKGGGLLSYGPDTADVYHRAAGHVDRVLRGGNPAELPVQLPVKFETAVNVKAAKAIGLTIPESFLLRADEVIE